MTRDLDTHWKFYWVMVNQQGLGEWMSFRTWIRLTVHWIVSDCDLGKVSVCTPSKDCVGYICTWLDAYVCGISRRNSFKGGENVRPRKIHVF